MYDADPDVKRVVDVAKGLEGLKRSDGIHAAAVVITKEPLTTYLPIQRKPEAGGKPEDAPVVTQYEMHGVEELGLLKMDFLGLRNLDVITDTVAMVRVVKDPDVRHRRRPARRPAGVRAARPRRHDGRVPARVAADARPAALAGADQLRRRRRARDRALPAGPDERQHALRLRRPQERPQAGRATSTRTPSEVLGDTYGLMIYQESVMRVAQKFAGYSLAEADNLRKAMGKKIARGDGQGARRRSRPAARRTGYGHDARQAAVRRHRAVRRLRLQQEPHLRLRPDHLPDGVPQGALPGRVLRLPADRA